MLNLIKPVKLKPGDKICTVSLSSGIAGDDKIKWRYFLAKKRLQELFGLDVVEMSNTLKQPNYIYTHPEKRAEDFMNAFIDPTIKGIFSCIGGNDSIRILPYIDFSVIADNPKIVMGYSDFTSVHFMCLKAGISSFYGPALLSEFAENGSMHEYTIECVKRALFSNDVIGEIYSSNNWTGDVIDWDEKYKNNYRKLYPNSGYEIWQGRGKISGHLVGGCLEVLEMIKATSIWPNKSFFGKAILFMESSGSYKSEVCYENWFRNYASQGIFNVINGIVVGKIRNLKEELLLKQALLKVVNGELGLTKLPIIYNLNFGHTSPMIILPFGAKAEIDCENKSFYITENSCC